MSSTCDLLQKLISPNIINHLFDLNIFRFTIQDVVLYYLSSPLRLDHSTTNGIYNELLCTVVHRETERIKFLAPLYFPR